MRKFYLSLVLPLLLLLAQQGAAWHEIGHLTDSETLAAASNEQQNGERQKQDDKKSSAHKFCELCLAFAQLGSSAKPEVPSLGLVGFGLAFPHLAVASTISADAPAPRNRGPPAFL